MPEVEWIKLTTGMFDDEKIKLIEAMPEADAVLVIWTKLICLAGKTNANGYIYITEDIPYTPEQLATLFNRKISIVKLALKIFEQFRMIEWINGHLFLPQFAVHQNIEGLDKIREQTRKRVANYRQRAKNLLPIGISQTQNEEDVTLSSVTVTQQNRIDKNRIDKNTPPISPLRGTDTDSSTDYNENDILLPGITVKKALMIVQGKSPANETNRERCVEALKEKGLI